MKTEGGYTLILFDDHAWTCNYSKNFNCTKKSYILFLVLHTVHECKKERLINFFCLYLG